MRKVVEVTGIIVICEQLTDRSIDDVQIVTVEIIDHVMLLVLNYWEAEVL